MGLLSQVDFPLGLALSWEESFRLIANDDPGWAEFVERVQSCAGFFVLHGFCCGEVETCYQVLGVFGFQGSSAGGALLVMAIGNTGGVRLLVCWH